MNVRRSTTYDFRVVETLPGVLEPRVLFVSLKYRTASHLCACGCGLEVVTPLSPAGWTVSFNGETASLSPSIGNWSFPCQSHYWLKDGRVRWSRKWTKEEIEQVREDDADDVRLHFRERSGRDREGDGR